MNKEQKELWKSAGIGASKALLIALCVGGVLVAPGGMSGVAELLNKHFEGKKVREYEQRRLEKALRYLKSRKFIDIQGEYQKDVYKLTKLGYFRARKLMKSFGVEKPKKWDGKWRMVVFDVPETKKDRRDVFRQQLKNLGLANLQQSIWIHPYECQDQVYYLAGNLFIKPYVRYVVAESLTGETELRRRFNLD